MKKFYCCIFAVFILSTAGAQIINFPDANFKAKLLLPDVAGDGSGNFVLIDANSNGEIEVVEAQVILSLSLSDGNISDLTGIEYFSNLQTLYCVNNPVTAMNLTPFAGLQQLIISGDSLANVNVAGLSNLNTFYCNHTLISSIDLSGLTALSDLDLNYNHLSSIDFTGLNALQSAFIGHNEFLVLDLSGLPSLGNLYVSNNPLTSLQLSNLPVLSTLTLSYTQLVTADLTSLPNLTGPMVTNNPLLEAILIRNGSDNLSPVFNFINNPNLVYICVDGAQEAAIIQDDFELAGISGVQIGTYCPLAEGGSYNAISGTSHFDANGNGCDASDNFAPWVQFLVSGGNVPNFISNNSGSYYLPVGTGNYTITPIIPNPSYFTISPPNLNLSFPAQSSPVQQDFCISANGIHNDVEVFIIPLSVAQPGFASSYKIVCRNVGSAAVSGALSFTFPDETSDFVNATPPVTSQQPAQLNWNFSNLQPFAIYEFVVNLLLNTPNATPPLVNGDILHFNASATVTSDENIYDNTALLTQTVVNSIDPNDKTCLEGQTVTEEMVGQYVHYQIRFENTGTANARNVVITDLIDLTQFDISSLLQVSASHSVVTRITDNKVEFIFENINLPFDDANNDGYVAFKIKTKPTLVLGNTFSNTANIYFDYNFPITTNTATTTIANILNKQDFAFDDYFKIYPNPAQNILYLQQAKTIEITSASIYDGLGQLLIAVSGKSDSIDVSNLATGTYFIKVVTKNGSAVKQFLRN